MNRFIIFLFFICLYFEIILCENENESELFSNKELEDIGSSAGDIVTSSSNAPSTEDKHIPNTNVAGNILKIIKNIPPPVIKINEDNLIDPDIICERDYSVPCPNDFNYIGSVYETDDEICAPSPTYDGPCMDKELNINDISDIQKESWSKKCQAFWPCKKCVRNFTLFCPEKWNRVKGSIRSCEPSESYNGPCKFVVHFSGYNTTMLEEWSLKCHAWWACDHTNVIDNCPDEDLPITPDSTRWRLKHNYQ
ncbi:CPW-WPC family protein, putative [Hepatocystis sp. ex Piliocolobus tephrosceles]|nr:CPW-WPC family protein, putative [Hepatocystis sp. ex Piliocolobus tephrosceles]